MSSTLTIFCCFFFLIPFPLLHVMIWRATAPAGGDSPAERRRFWVAEGLAGAAGLVVPAGMLWSDPGLFREGVAYTSFFLMPLVNGGACLVFPALHNWLLGAGDPGAIPPARHQLAWGLSAIAAIPPVLLLFGYLGDRLGR